ncbi:hypothetical protein F5I97DRAFT_1172888 [Phlebopus sp. FC_14]|nr:hypothetical protein F5I97DRAFT_1172888 [Phlebopus sp. FC_14]
MLRSFKSPKDPNDDYLKNLLDQRNARADISAHAPIPSLIDFADSPSVYSHAYFSPQPPEKDIGSDPTPLISKVSPRHRVTEGEPRVSSGLDDQNAEHEVDSDEDDSDSSRRISLQGPKIRFHSRPPWETSEEDLQVEEFDHSSKPGILGYKFKGKASKADSLIRTFGRGASIASRPSIESSRSQSPSKTSLEMTANYSTSRGALYALAQESMSTSSLSGSTHPFPPLSSTVHQNFSLPRTRNSPPSGHSSKPTHGVATTSWENGLTSPNTAAPCTPSSGQSCDDDRSPTPSSIHPSQGRASHDDFVHPYANPDLVLSYTPASISVSPHRSVCGNITRSDSNATVTDSLSTISVPFSAMSTETSATSIPSRGAPKGQRLNGKDISSPIAVLRASDFGAVHLDRNSKFMSLHRLAPGSNDIVNQPHSSTVTLISLQEAQARERSRSATVHTTSPPHSKEHHASRVPFPNPDNTPNVGKTQGGEAYGNSTRGRARSTSAGGRAKDALHSMIGAPQLKPERKNSETSVSPIVGPPSGRVLKHKKSGLMRLFSNRGADVEKSPPPPVPSLADSYAEFNPQPKGIGKASKLSLPRVPIPSLSPSLVYSGTDASLTVSSTSIEGDDFDGRASSRRRQPPPLNVLTGNPTACSLLSTSEPSFSSHGAFASSVDLPPPSNLSLDAPQSAPPSTTDFQGLKLRPISTSFSAHFADIVASPEAETHLDLDTPRSSGTPETLHSPITPVSTPRRSEDTVATTTDGSGEQSLVIKALQQQIVSAKKAWQQQIWDLRGQVRDLQAEVRDLRVSDNGEYCDVCGRGDQQKRCIADRVDETQTRKGGIVNRPRARTGDAARFASGN